VSELPPDGLSREKRDDLHIMFNAIVDYHNNLAQMRFYVAALYLAATGFLAGGWFGDGARQSSDWLIPFLGLAFTLACLILEFRTQLLLWNLGARGRKIERKLKVPSGKAFFALMDKQPLPRRWNPGRSLISHTFGLGIIYVSVTIFWIVVLVAG
jgi:hypothetical protein